MQKIVSLLVLLFLSNYAFSQSKKREFVSQKIVYFDSLDNETTKDFATYYKIYKYYKKKEDVFTDKEFYSNGKKKKSEEKISTTKGKDGKVSYYFENGKLQKTLNYEYGILSGESREWYENGKQKEEGIYSEIENKQTYTIANYWNKEGKQLAKNGEGIYEESENNFNKFSCSGPISKGNKNGVWTGIEIAEIDNKTVKHFFTEKFEDGEFISGESKNEFKSSIKYNEVLTKAVPITGISDFYAFLLKQFKTPETEGPVKGTIYIGFIVEKNGTLSNFKTIKDLGFDTGNIAIEAIKQYKTEWKPAFRRGFIARSKYIIPISVNEE